VCAPSRARLAVTLADESPSALLCLKRPYSRHTRHNPHGHAVPEDTRRPRHMQTRRCAARIAPWRRRPCDARPRDTADTHGTLRTGHRAADMAPPAVHCDTPPSLISFTRPCTPTCKHAGAPGATRVFACGRAPRCYPGVLYVCVCLRARAQHPHDAWASAAATYHAASAATSSSAATRSPVRLSHDTARPLRSSRAAPRLAPPSRASAGTPRDLRRHAA
jgi:hypothetical protein